jgi:hypothetical protein
LRSTLCEAFAFSLIRLDSLRFRVREQLVKTAASRRLTSPISNSTSVADTPDLRGGQASVDV